MFLSEKAVEGSTFGIVFSFTDSAGASVVPNSLVWTLTDKDGNVINSRSSESITPGASVTVVLSGDDLALPDEDDAVRVVKISGDYDDPIGNGLPIIAQAIFEIENVI